MTILDIAKASGVSKSTVSRVINGDKEVSEKTRLHVKAVIAKMGYKPNAMARGMRTNKSFAIGIVLPDLGNEFFPEWYAKLSEEMQQFGYLGYIVVTDPNGATEYDKLKELAAHNMDGIVFMSYVKNKKVFDLLTDINKSIPVVCQDQFATNCGLPYVCPDGYSAMIDAVKYLAETGRKKIACIGPEGHFETTQLRFDGYKKGLRELGLPINPDWIYRGNFKSIDGYKAADYFMSLDAKPDAILSVTDVMGLGCLERLKDMGVKVPEDMAVFGFDDIRRASEVRPGLSTIKMPVETLAEKTVQLLMDRISDQQLIDSELIPCELVIRASS